jgi:hypothetical protein
LRYTEAGIRTRAVWEETWALQRAEDRGDVVTIDVPRKYEKGDFLKGIYWTHRGKLDVPKERFISYPAAGADGSDLYGWAGWDHAQQAQALAAHIVEAQDHHGAPEPTIAQLLNGLSELLPWIQQWHPDTDPRYGSTLHDIYSTFHTERTQRLNVRSAGATDNLL